MPTDHEVTLPLELAKKIVAAFEGNSGISSYRLSKHVKGSRNSTTRDAIKKMVHLGIFVARKDPKNSWDSLYFNEEEWLEYLEKQREDR